MNIILCILFLKSEIILCISPFHMHKIIYFSRRHITTLGFPSKFRQGRVALNTDYFCLALQQNQVLNKCC